MKNVYINKQQQQQNLTLLLTKPFQEYMGKYLSVSEL